MNNSLITKYRPSSWDQFKGNEAAVRGLQSAVSKGTSRAFLITGGAGIGKTTLSRLIASELGYEYRERDAATFSGVDKMRELCGSLQYASIKGYAGIVQCLDECHALSKTAWDSALKCIEEPPPHLVWVLCTTEPRKVPGAIKTRCLHVDLNPVPARDLRQLGSDVWEAENEEKIGDDLLDALVEHSEGSPRQLLSTMSLVLDAAEDEALVLLDKGSFHTCPETIDLVRKLGQPKANWKGLTKALKTIEGFNPTAFRAVVLAYYTKILMSKLDRRALQILDAFEEPFKENKMHEVLLRLGEIYA